MRQKEEQKAISMLFLLSVLLLSACGQLGDEKAMQLLAFDTSTLIHSGERSYYNNQSNGWYLTRGMAQTDTTVRYKDAVSLHLSPTHNDSVMQAAIYYSISSDEVEGYSICFSGKYK